MDIIPYNDNNFDLTRMYLLDAVIGGDARDGWKTADQNNDWEIRVTENEERQIFIELRRVTP